MKMEKVQIILLLISIELTLVDIVNISISNYNLSKYPFGLTQELPPIYWITEFITAVAFIIPLIRFKDFDRNLYNYTMPIIYLLLLFDTFFIFYFINPFFILSRDELGHSAEVLGLLFKHTTMDNPDTYQAYYPLGFIYGGISFLISGFTPTSYFIFFGPMFFTIFQNLVVYALLRLFFESPKSELGILIYMLSSMPFYVAEWSPQLMSYNLLFPVFLILGLVIKRGGIRFAPLLILLSELTGLTDIGTFGSAITIIISVLVFSRKIGKLNLKFIAYTAVLTASVYIYWVYFNPLAQGALGGVHVLINDLVEVIESIFVPQATKNLVLPTSTLIYTFIPSSPYHLYSVISKLLDGGIFLLTSIISFIYLVVSKKTNNYIWLAFSLGSGLLLMQSAIGLADNISNVLTRMIPQAMTFYTIIIIYFLYNRKILKTTFTIFLVALIPISVLGYSMIATSEHSPEAAFLGGKLLGEYGIITPSTYGFYVAEYSYEGKIMQSYGTNLQGIKFAGPYIETLELYFGGPTEVNDYQNYYNGIVQNYTIFFNSGDLIAGVNCFV
ncbi:MAG: hypothetical protein QXY87_10890 [Saccharolobus sp.]|uniref:Uncharacterized protein n=1 Tax=Saccharolobus shibatae (strain ATCC 51178 / DSM 5389 / JCM 8931 / NBRC 15437 / B12) TaxID=523848 RepID=A0A8F5BNZ1_SACSH|nr:hypothetical protein [Saccharolobus shibatae]MCH4816725.1 hypothetical protein [Saccharolobus shibatae]QXJ28661.1 hypothetical protein J5U23_01530 [Saccharolobus shibatae B12]